MAYLLHHLLERSALKFPDKIALSWKGFTITYKDLNAGANELGNILQQNGVKKGDRVGIYLEKSIDSIVAIHGILKAGAVYVPLDASAPAARIGYIIENCAIVSLVTNQLLLANINQILVNTFSLSSLIMMQEEVTEPEVTPPLPQLKSIFCQKNVNSEETNAPPNDVIWTDLAYILYTSGSTGNPKGVMISHLNALTFINWAYDTFNVDENDIFSSHAPLHFDLSIFDIFVALKAGAEIAIVPEELSYFPYSLVEWIHSNQISVWYSVPSILTMILLKGGLERFDLDRLRYIVFAGEVFPIKYLKDLTNLLSHVEFFNLYGPTETNVITYYHVPSLAPEQTAPIPIGKPCANMELLILGDANTIVTEPGIEGELYARGTMVAQGYWGNQEKTREVFLNNLNGILSNDRFYKTGDRVKIDEEGNLLFLGRKDHMVKSRGYRIELGEIESVLYNHPAIKDVAVVAVPDEKISNRIISFVCLQDENEIELTELRRYCGKYLPKYMVPETFKILTSLPKTTTGKVNRPALVSSEIGSS